MIDIQSATAEIKQGKKKKEEETGQNIMSASAAQGGHNNHLHITKNNACNYQCIK